MQLNVGEIYEGKVTGITKFGAFVELDEKTTGMVHISEVANTFVSEISEFLKAGDIVKVKVMTVGDDGKIALSIKKALPPAPRPQFKSGNSDKPSFKKFDGQNNKFPPKKAPEKPKEPNNWNAVPVATGPTSFEDMLSKFKQNSDERMGDLKRNLDGKRKGSSKRGRV